MPEKNYDENWKKAYFYALGRYQERLNLLPNADPEVILHASDGAEDFAHWYVQHGAANAVDVMTSWFVYQKRSPVIHDAAKAKMIKTLTDLVNQRFEDGSSVVEYVLYTNPTLRIRLQKALFGNE